ncbi:MAG: tellurite resistance TerB family protein [Rhizobiaceae bacterium]|nr:tellurite resistance TerB family protein [Rhizobiaceae bacterium]
MFDPKKMLDELLGSNVPGTSGTVRDQAGKAVQMAKDNPLAAGALAAVLLGTGAGRKMTGSAIKLGGLAAIGGLAYKAYQNYKAGQNPVQETAAREPELLPPPSETPFHPSQAPQGEAEFVLTLIRGMISAAKADGHIDDEERKKIIGRIGLAGLDSDASAFLDKELASPLNLDDLVAQAQTEAQRVELYTASRLAINADTRAERGYLDLLAGRLNLPDTLVDHIEATISGATVPVEAEASDASSTRRSPW